MPFSAIHRKLTRFALAAAPELFAGCDTEALVQTYCCYPDSALMPDGDEAKKFLYEPDGVPFHYLPDAPLENLYRHYRRGADGKLNRARGFVNPHFEFARAGLVHYLTRISGDLRAGRRTDAMKSAGVLLHVLQDNSFGVHTLEGVGGTDVFFFDRLNVWEDSPFDALCRLDCGDPAPVLPRAPQVLGNSPEEAALRIYRRWCDAIRIGRTVCVRFLLDRKTDPAPMAAASVLLCADVLRTLSAFSGRSAETPLALTDFEPYEPPCRDFAESLARTLTFPVRAEEHLLYWFFPGMFDSLFAVVGTRDGAVRYESVNGGATVRSGVLQAGERVTLTLDRPENICGFKFFAERGAVRIQLTDTELRRPQTRTDSLPPQ